MQSGPPESDARIVESALACAKDLEEERLLASV